MSIEERLWDDSAFMRPGEEMPEPVTLRHLCVDLRVERQPKAKQAAAVREWLNDNVPNVNLRRSIERSGLFTPAELRTLLAA